MSFLILAVAASILISHGAMGGNEDSTSSVIWNLDNLARIGGNAVTVVGNPVVRDFEFGKGTEFDGFDDGLIVHGCPLDKSASFTLEILFKPYASFPNNEEQRFFHIQNPGLGSRRMLIELRLNANNEWFIDTHIRADSSLLTCLAKEFLHPVDRWYHVAFVYEKGEARHFVDGVEEMSGRVPYIPVENAEVALGMRMNKVWFFKGAIRAVAMARRALRPGEFALSSRSSRTEKGNSKSALLFFDDFRLGANSWIAEFEDPASSSLSADNGVLDVNASAGATIWFKQRLTGSILIVYDVTVVDSGGKNDRVSDLNAFWMASDPQRSDPFTRDGKFSSYDNLDLYYAGVGAHDNTTTRFRRYHHEGEKPVLKEYIDKAHLLEGNNAYSIAIKVEDGRTSFSVDEVLFLDCVDEEPMPEGYFAFRITRSHQRISNFRVYRLSGK